MAFSSYYNSIIMISFTLFLVMVSMASFSSAQLSPGFYSKSCPKAFSTIRSGVQSAISKENRIGASILRLFFHDCFVHGCDGSILLDDTPTFKGEQTARPNNRSARGFGVVEAIKAKVEAVCPGVVSCADVLAIAARDSVVILGGPNWDVKLGRRDSKTASFNDANDGRLPGPTSNLTNLIRRFQAVGLSARDMVALSGAHTIGQARCTTFRAHIYNDTNIDPSFAKHRQSRCPKTVGKGDDILAPLDFQTPNGFDNKYFQHLVIKKGLLHSDQVLYNGDSTDSLVKAYSQNPKTFNCDFVKAMIKMGDISPLTGSRGEIRKKCGRPN